jgi:hypothetical protein
MPGSFEQRSKFAEQALWFARWIAFVPAAWQTGHVHYWILKLFGVAINENSVAVNDHDLLAWAVAGIFTPLCVVAVGAWVCPTKRKVWPVLFLCAVFVFAGVSTLRRGTTEGQLWHPIGLNAILMVAVSVAISGACTLISWRRAASR